MRLLRRILLWLLAIVVGTVVFLAGSVLIDALIGRGRVDALANTRIARGSRAEISAYARSPITQHPIRTTLEMHQDDTTDADDRSRISSLPGAGDRGS